MWDFAYFSVKWDDETGLASLQGTHRTLSRKMACMEGVKREVPGWEVGEGWHMASLWFSLLQSVGAS